MNQPCIVVIGAGPMGLAVAYQLVRAGLKPVLYEADDRIGGMTASFDFDGQQLERYYHFHCISDQAFMQILEECGLSGAMRWTETKMGFFCQDQVHPWGNPLALLRFPWLGLAAKVRYRLHALACTRRTDWRPLDSLAAVPWIQHWVGQEAYNLFWDKLFTYKFYGYAGDVSAAWIWSRIRRIGRSRYNIFREKLGYLDGGSDTLLRALRQTIEAGGGKIHLQSPVQRVAVEGGRIKGVLVNGVFETCDAVISTVPLPMVPKMIPDLPQPALDGYRRLKNVAAVCVVVRLNRPVTENFWLNINDPALDIPGLVEYSNLRPMQGHIVYAPFYLPADLPKYFEADHVFEAKVRTYLRQINPALTDESFLGLRTHRYRYAQPVCEPGHLDRLPTAKTEINGLWVADTSHYYPEDRSISESLAEG